MQWPFSSKMAALQHLMSFKTVPDEKAKKASFDHVSSSGFQPVSAKNSFEPSYRASSVKETPQVLPTGQLIILSNGSVIKWISLAY